MSATTTAQTGDEMSLESIAADVKSAVDQGQAWLARAVEEHLPALAAEAQRITASPIYQEYAGLVLPPEVEAEIATVVRAMVKVAGIKAAEPSAPAEPPAAEVPAEPVADAPAQ